MATESIGFVGVGRMGGRMARRLLDAGLDLTIYDTSETVMRPLVERGAHVAESAAAVASACEIADAADRGSRRTRAARDRGGNARQDFH